MCEENEFLQPGDLVSLGGPGLHLFLECPKQDQDIVFLIDGSGSISSDNFKTMLNFVEAVMSQFQGSSTQVCVSLGA